MLFTDLNIYMQIESFTLSHNKDWLGASEKLWRNGKK